MDVCQNILNDNKCRKMLWIFSFGILCCITFIPMIRAFHSGAPVEACDSLLPRHLRTSPKPEKDSPYIFTASAGRFYPDSKRRKIKVRIKGAAFKGFFVVALDANSLKRMGTFLDARGMQSVPCSAVTHTDGHPKVMATFLWLPPEDMKSGEVLFRATILESFSVYYSNLVASVPGKKTALKIFRNSTACDPGNDCNFSNAYDLNTNLTLNEK